MKASISILLVDEDPAAPEGLVTRIRAQPGFLVLAASARLEEVMDRVRDGHPDLVLLNLHQRGDENLTIAGALHGELPRLPVVILGVEASEQDVASFLRAGVSGFVMAGASFDTFLTTVRSVAIGIKVLPAALTRSLFGQLKRHSVQGRPKRLLEIARLTGRERQVADLMVLGLSNQGIATRLEIALHTVKSHVHRVLSKLAVGSRLEVAAALF